MEMLLLLLGLLGLGAAFGGLGGASEEDSEADPAPSDPPADPLPDMPELPASEYDIGWDGLSEEEQLMVELVNRARLDPTGEADRQGVALADGVSSTPVEALAVLPELSVAARLHSQDMEAKDYFSHTSQPGGETPTERAQAEGWDGGGVYENIGAKYTDADRISDLQAWVEDHHANLWASTGHQQNLMLASHDVIGMGYALGDYYDGTKYYPTASFVTEGFASDSGATYLTGVVIDDMDGDAFYDLGEGQGGVQITAWNDAGAYATSTWGSGGYTLELAAGTYTVHFEGGELAAAYETTVVIGDENVKLDVIEGSGAIATATVEAPQTDSGDEGASVLDYVPDEAATDDPLAQLFGDMGVLPEDGPLPEDTYEDDPEIGFFALL